MLRMMAVLAMLSLAACSSSSDKNSKNNGWEFNNDNPDTGQDASNNSGGPDGGGPDGGGPIDMGGPDMPPPAQQVEFRLINNSEVPLFAYQSVAGTCSGGAFVQVLENGQAHPLVSDCTMCDCAAEECALCEIDCLPGSDIQGLSLGAGDARTFTWDGLLRVQDANDEGYACYDARPPLTDTLTARFCWGHEFDVEFDTWGQIAGVECQEVEFDIDDDVVEFEIMPSAREQLAFELVNASMDTLYASIGHNSPCIFDEWLIVSQQEQELLMTLPCGECLCNEVNADSMCPLPCPAACAAPTPELYEFPPGDVRQFYWNRAYYVRGEVDETMCLDDRRAGGELTAEFCWATGFDDSTLSLVDERCETVRFDPMDQKTVRYEITP